MVYFSSPSTEKKRAAVIVPMEHEALRSIVRGLQEGLQEKMGEGFELKVMNAQGDMNIQRAIILQLVQEEYDVLIPIGTTASQMTLNLAPEKQIVCLAADPKLLSAHKTKHATLLDDRVSVGSVLAVMHETQPMIKKMTLIYSASEKVAKEVPEVVEEAHKLGIHVQKLMVQTLAELYTASASIDQDCDAIFVLKDHLIVSGIQTIIQQAEKMHIPVITSDEGSVLSGGAFALGVQESRIGAQGAQMVYLILQGTAPELIPCQSLEGSHPLFINRQACERQGVDAEKLIEFAQDNGVEYVCL